MVICWIWNQESYLNMEYEICLLWYVVYMTISAEVPATIWAQRSDNVLFYTTWRQKAIAPAIKKMQIARYSLERIRTDINIIRSIWGKSRDIRILMNYKYHRTDLRASNICICRSYLKRSYLRVTLGITGHNYKYSLLVTHYYFIWYFPALLVSI